MIRFLVLLGLLVAAFAPHGAEARVQHPPTFFFCPFGAVVPDGCGQAPQAQPGSSAVLYTTARQAGGIINQLTGSPTDYSVNAPKVNLPAIDFSVGEPLPLSTLKDPTQTGILPSGCVLNPTGGPGSNPVITCTLNVPPGPASVVFDSFDMTVGGTTCVALSLVGNTTATSTITNNNWKNNGNCSIGVFNPEMLASALGQGDVIVKWNTLDGNGLAFPYDYGSCPPPTGNQLPNCNPIQGFIFSGGVVFQYNVVTGFTARTVQYASTGNTSKGFLFQYNLLQGCCSDNPNAHGELEEYAGNPGASGETYDSNTVIVPTSHHLSGQAGFPTQFVTANAIPVFDVSSNFYVPGAAGGGTLAVPAITGSVTGGTLTTTAITALRTLASGSIITCGTAPNTAGFMLVYDGTNANVVSAGPGGGGNSNGNTATTWPLTYFGGVMQAGIDNGSGGAGNIVNVTVDPSLTIQVGTSFSINFVTHHVISFGSGSGGAGTYNVDGAAQVFAVGSVSVNPPNIFPGGWTVPATLSSCIMSSQSVAPFTRAIADETTPGGLLSPGPMGQVTHQGNYADLWVYGPGTGGHIWSQRTNSETFYGTIATNALTLIPAVRSTTVNVKGTGYTSATVTYGSGCTVQNPTGTASVSGGLVNSITQTQDGIGCTSTPSVTIGGPGTGATATANVTTSSSALVLGQYLLDNGPVAAGTILQSGTTPNYVVSGSQTISSPVLMTATQTYCTNPTIWGSTLGNPNVDMSGTYNSTIMNSYAGENVLGNGCQ